MSDTILITNKHGVTHEVPAALWEDGTIEGQGLRIAKGSGQSPPRKASAADKKAHAEQLAAAKDAKIARLVRAEQQRIGRQAVIDAAKAEAEGAADDGDKSAE